MFDLIGDTYDKVEELRIMCFLLLPGEHHEVSGLIHEGGRRYRLVVTYGKLKYYRVYCAKLLNGSLFVTDVEEVG